MDHRVRVAEAFAKRVANGDLSDNRIVDRIHHQQAFGVDGTSAGTGTYTQRVERRKRIRPKLNASPDFANLRGLLQHLDTKPLSRDRQRRCKPSNAATSDYDGVFATRCVHVASLI